MTRNCWEGGAGGGNNQEGRYHSGPVLPGPLGGRPEPLGGRPELSRLNLSFHGRYHPPQTFPPTSPESPKGIWRIRALKASWGLGPATVFLIGHEYVLKKTVSGEKVAFCLIFGFVGCVFLVH